MNENSFVEPRKTVRILKWNRNETVSKQFRNSFETVSKLFHFDVRTV